MNPFYLSTIPPPGLQKFLTRSSQAAIVLQPYPYPADTPIKSRVYRSLEPIDCGWNHLKIQTRR